MGLNWFKHYGIAALLIIVGLAIFSMARFLSIGFGTMFGASGIFLVGQIIGIVLIVAGGIVIYSYYKKWD